MAFKMKGPSLMKMVKEAGMKMKEPMKLKKDSPMDLNKGFDKLPEDVQSKILKKIHLRRNTSLMHSAKQFTLLKQSLA